MEEFNAFGAVCMFVGIAGLLVLVGVVFGMEIGDRAAFADGYCTALGVEAAKVDDGWRCLTPEAVVVPDPEVKP